MIGAVQRGESETEYSFEKITSPSDPEVRHRSHVRILRREEIDLKYHSQVFRIKYGKFIKPGISRGVGEDDEMPEEEIRRRRTEQDVFIKRGQCHQKGNHIAFLVCN